LQVLLQTRCGQQGFAPLQGCPSVLHGGPPELEPEPEPEPPPELEPESEPELEPESEPESPPESSPVGESCPESSPPELELELESATVPSFELPSFELPSFEPSLPELESCEPLSFPEPLELELELSAGGSHWAAMQSSPVAHRLPHRPQLLGSFERFAQYAASEPQRVWPLTHASPVSGASSGNEPSLPLLLPSDVPSEGESPPTKPSRPGPPSPPDPSELVDPHPGAAIAAATPTAAASRAMRSHEPVPSSIILAALPLGRWQHDQLHYRNCMACLGKKTPVPFSSPAAGALRGGNERWHRGAGRPRSRNRWRRRERRHACR